jgi:hypothetical protein
MSGQRVIRPGKERPGSRRTPLIRPIVDIDGTVVHREEPDVSDMSTPALCSHCGSIYDVGHVTVTARYSDCSLWNAPCCGRQADSRHAWNNQPGARMGYVDIRARDRLLAERRVR